LSGIYFASNLKQKFDRETELLAEKLDLMTVEDSNDD